MDNQKKNEGADAGAPTKPAKSKPAGATTQIVVIVGKKAFGPFVNIQQFAKYRPGLELVGMVKPGEEVQWYPLVTGAVSSDDE